MDQHRHSPQPTVQYSWDSVHVSDSGFSTQLRSFLVPDQVPDAGIFHEIWGSSPLLSTSQQHGNGYCPPIVSQVDAMANIYTPVVVGSSNHQPSPTFSQLDETSVDDNTPQRPFMALLSSFPDVFPGPQTRVEMLDARFAVQVDSVGDGSQRNQHFDSDTFQTGWLSPPFADDQMSNEFQIITDVVANSSDHERYRTETQIPMTPFGAKPLPDGSYPPASSKNSTSGSTRLRTRSQETIRISPTHNKGEYLVPFALAPPSQLCTPQDRGMRVDKTAKEQYQCRSCWVVFAQRQSLSRHHKDKHEPKNQCSFCTEFTWSKGRHYVYRRHLQEEHRDVVLSPVTNNA
ncbi:hypothetical protein EDB85DRAFT_2023151 [Lactarius pseudohatsudake]|nr:hypothetical protein EDB85DRAFT_2023151 [Lactarius pseudohatsudake]